MIRVVLDTNILVSAMLRSSGNEALVLNAVRHGALVPCLSEDVLQEYREVLVRAKFSFPPTVIEGLLALLRENGVLFQAGPSAHKSSPAARFP